MDKEKFLEEYKKYMEEVTSTKEKALAFRVRLGTNYPDGSLTPEYGGNNNYIRKQKINRILNEQVR